MFKHKKCDYCWIPSQFSVSFRVHPCSYAPYSFASTQYLTKMPFLESLLSIRPRYFTSISVGRSLMFSSAYAQMVTTATRRFNRRLGGSLVSTDSSSSWRTTSVRPCPANITLGIGKLPSHWRCHGFSARNRQIRA